MVICGYLIIVSCLRLLITYKENPHLDTKARGIQAAKIMAGMVRGEVRPTQAVVKPPMMYNIVYQYTSVEPLARLMERLSDLACRALGRSHFQSPGSDFERPQ